MTLMNTHPGTPVRGLRRAFLQAAIDLLTARDRRRPADRGRARPRLEGLEDRCLLSNTITEFPVPTTSAGVRGITAGPDGNLWFGEFNTNKVATINPTTHAISEFTVPTAKHASAGIRGITTGPDGNLWFTEQNASKIGMINPTTHAITAFATPSVGSYPRGIVAGPDSNLWFAEASSSSKIGMINPATDVITEFTVPTAGARPAGICAGPEGNLWFTEAIGNKIGTINPTTHAISEFPIPTAAAYAVGITAGPDGNIWFAEQESAGKIGVINPTTQAITEYPVPYANTLPYGVATGPDGNLWFTDLGADAIGLVTLDQTSNMHLVITQQPPASVTAGSGFGLTVQVQNKSGTLVTSYNGTVTVGLASNPGGTTLSGTLTVAASGGVATFSGLTISTPASGYTIYVSSSGPVSTITNSITVTTAWPMRSMVRQQPTSTLTASGTTASDLSLAPQVLDSPDLWDGLRFKKRSWSS
jgi:streptogramin lyase